jgi:hypothetical protein
VKQSLVEFVLLATLVFACAFEVVGLETMPKRYLGLLLTPNAVYQGF